jgi:hypothetical protein
VQVARSGHFAEVGMARANMLMLSLNTNTYEFQLRSGHRYGCALAESMTTNYSLHVALYEHLSDDNIIPSGFHACQGTPPHLHPHW